MSAPIKQNNLDLQSILNTINNLPEAGSGGEVDLPELSNPGTAADLLEGKELIDENGEVVTGTIQTKTSSDIELFGSIFNVPRGYYDESAQKEIPEASIKDTTINVNSSGLVTANTIVSTGGYISIGPLLYVEKQLDTQSAKTITPTKSSQTAVAAQKFTTGAVTVAPIPNEYITTADATANAGEIMSGETAYVNGSKVTGTFSIDSELSTQDDLIAQIKSAVDSLPEAGSGGGSVETCTVTVINNLFDAGIGTTDEDERLWNSMIAYTDASSNVIINYLPISSADPADPGFVPTTHTYTVLKGTIMFAPFGISGSSANLITDAFGYSPCIIINNDCTVDVG